MPEACLIVGAQDNVITHCTCIDSEHLLLGILLPGLQGIRHGGDHDNFLDVFLAEDSNGALAMTKCSVGHLDAMFVEHHIHISSRAPCKFYSCC